jgi:kinesin family protein 11
VDVDGEAGTVDLNFEGGAQQFKYDKVFTPEATQEELYNSCCAPIVEEVTNGVSCAVFAYGQTGSGKTHTMRGNLDNESQHGVIQRSLEALFRRFGEKDYGDVKLKVSFLEIYNEELEDLFSPVTHVRSGGKAAQGETLRLIDHKTRGAVCHNLMEVPITTTKEALSMLAEAEKKSHFSATKMNKTSNRAHRVFTVVCNFKRWGTDDTESTLTFIDLAGSEDIKRSGAEGLTAREAKNINKSLLTLGRVINALACNERHIPYRDSKLTRLLSEALGGVCKTSFIACVSPCATSNTETNSTLRYAEQAMEALNISQLPRWKQDEIIINGLTRQNEMLRNDLERQAKAHQEELQELENENSALKEENSNLQGEIRRLKFRVNKLTSRKTALKSGLSAMTAQRDLLQAQKEALREELLDTRMERDGYLNDRSIMFTVLASVRQMRNRLLDVHTNTEGLLTKDALELKRVVEGTIEDIAELHVEVDRKKALSVHNEKTADEYRERMSENVRSVIQSVLDFKSGQDVLHSDLANMLIGLRDQNQKDTSGNRSGLTSLSSKTSTVLESIASHARETEQALITRISERKDDADKYRSTVSLAVGKFRGAVTGQLETLRTHTASLEDDLGEWAAKLKTKLDDRSKEVKSFTDSVTTGLAGMQASVDSATTKQLDLLATHSDQLSKHLAAEKATMAEESSTLIKEIQSYVNRVVSDFSNAATRRTETAVSGFQTETEVMTGATKEFKQIQTELSTTMVSKTANWKGESERSLDDGRTSNESMHQKTKGVNAVVVKTSQAAEKDMNTGADATDKLAKDYAAATEVACGKAKDFVTKRRAEMETKTSVASEAIALDNTGIQTNVQAQSEGMCASADTMKSKMTSTITNVRDTSEALNTDLVDTEADGNNYVAKEIKRDALAKPVHKKYQFPTDYEKTDPYEKILADLPSDWSRESKIRGGVMQPGKGPDYPGDDGAEDVSGIYTETEQKEPGQLEASRLEDAARQSDDEEYEGESAEPGSPTKAKASLAEAPAEAPAVAE